MYTNWRERKKKKKKKNATIRLNHAVAEPYQTLEVVTTKANRLQAEMVLKYMVQIPS